MHDDFSISIGNMDLNQRAKTANGLPQPWQLKSVHCPEQQSESFIQKEPSPSQAGTHRCLEHTKPLQHRELSKHCV